MRKVSTGCSPHGGEGALWVKLDTDEDLSKTIGGAGSGTGGKRGSFGGSWHGVQYDPRAWSGCGAHRGAHSGGRTRIKRRDAAWGRDSAQLGKAP